ncbi:hypothetical protein NHX12_016806%2C partial [Xyrichtys novacula]|uniref:SPIN-DOC-like zinc-finger domain-containing protein n=1 Tax=Xyrichtys novacula TaxID=13765 RepID=A0AAV1F9K5_XYRNO|nr:hypothetical protein NHX12_016806%2C partial [Xyrichtys novacula]
MAKRKKDDEYRPFQDEWTEEFAFVERAGSAVCLICNDKIASMKRSNVKRHFDTRHATFASKYPVGDSQKKACQELLSRVQATQQHLRVWTRQGDYNSASFAGSLPIMRNGKPFTDGEYAKTFMLDVANELFDDLPNKDKIIKRIQDMPLSARTVHDRESKVIESGVGEQAHVDRNEKTSTRRPADYPNLERTSCHIRHTEVCEYCCIDHVWIHVFM